MSSSLQVGIIGCGAIGTEHAQCLASLEGVSLRGFCDTNAERAAALTRVYANTYSTTSPADLLADDAIEAVYICTHTDSHSALGIAAAHAGKHIMMEKPLALTTRECFDVAEAVEKSGVTFMTAFKLRFNETVQRARAFIPAPTLAIAQMTDLHWPTTFWGNDPIKGGGNVLSQGCHSVDLLYHLIGSEPVRIYAEGGNYHHLDVSITDTLVATIQFENGALGSLVQADSGHTPFLSKLSFQLLDGVRSAHLHNRLKSLTLWDGARIEQFEAPHETGMIGESQAFIRAIREKTPPPTTVRDGVRATLVLLAAIEASRTQTPQMVHV
jgi:predicted dehydrogenase